MDRATAFKRLPELYARALLLKEEGLDEEAIAERLGIPEEAVGPALRVAELKLARIVMNGAARRKVESNDDGDPCLPHNDTTTKGTE